MPKKYNYTKKTGRPTKYRSEFPQMLLDFFNIEPTHDEEVVYTNKKGDTWSKIEKKANLLPTIERFAHSIDVNDDTIVTWVKAKRSDGSLKYPKFTAAYTRAKQLQRDILVQNGLSNGYNSNFAMFIARSIGGIQDKVAIPVDDKGNPVPFVAGFNLVPPAPLNDEGKTDNNPDA